VLPNPPGPLAGDKFVDYVHFTCQDRHDDELGDAIHRVDCERASDRFHSETITCPW